MRKLKQMLRLEEYRLLLKMDILAQIYKKLTRTNCPLRNLHQSNLFASSPNPKSGVESGFFSKALVIPIESNFGMI
jgi:hypothetical protein